MAEKKTIECHATSSFSIEGEHVETGTTIEVSEDVYKDLRTAQRVEPGPAPTALRAKGKAKAAAADAAAGAGAPAS